MKIRDRLNTFKNKFPLALLAFLITAQTAFALDVVSIPPNPDITVASGTPYASLGLPTSTLAALEGGETISLPILWDRGTPFYALGEPGTYAFSGSLFLLGSTTNTNNLKSSLNVTVGSSAATSTATTTPSTATTTATSTRPERGTGEGAVGGHRRDVSPLLAPGFSTEQSQGQVLGTSTGPAMPFDLQQQLSAAVQQLANLLQRFVASLASGLSGGTGTSTPSADPSASQYK